MGLKQTIKQDLDRATKEGKELEVSALRMLLAAIHNKEIEKRKKEEGLSDEEIIEVISTEVKKRKEAEGQYEKGGRQDLAEKEKREREILSKYMPEQLSEEEIRKLAKETIEKLGAEGPSDTGRVMGALMPQLKGKADGQVVSNIVKELLLPKESDDYG